MSERNDILADLLRVQNEIRELEQDQLAYSFEDQSRTRLSRVTQTTVNSTENESFSPVSGASISPGTEMVVTPTTSAQDVAWADFWRSGQTPEFGKPTCANGTNCLDDNFCYSWFDCGPCEWCENNQCVEKDENRICQEDWECPCPPNDDQFYQCLEGRCSLTCRTNDDCYDCQVCDQDSFTCQPGCKSDSECRPGSVNAAPDARAGTYCVDCECITPCDASKLCDGPDDGYTCGKGSYCTEKTVRASTDPSFEEEPVLYECVSGCATDSQCEVEVHEVTDEATGITTRYERQPVCVDNGCLNVCLSNGDCIGALGESCVSGTCQVVGQICNSDFDCEEGEYCGDGRCQSGCRSSDECYEVCEKDSECADNCPPEPTCTCTDLFTAEDCDNNPDLDWQQYCERDPACLSACPDDLDCVAANSRNLSCINNTCKMTCPCPDGYLCAGQECIAISDEPEVVCVQTENCETLESGDLECVITEECREVPRYQGSRFSGCDCSETCNTRGQCVDTICRFDSDCESCSYCSDGICVPGCDEENPCGPGQCCQGDGKCHEICRTDSDCPGPETCLEGCCGTACEPTIECVSSQNCPDGWSCGVSNICEQGCVRDSDCPFGICITGEEGGIGTCVEPCVADDDCGSGFSCYENSFCRADVQPCSNDGECPNDFEICLDGSCQYGCRSDDECGTSSLCVDNVCEYICSNDDECSQLGYGDKCERSSKARAQARSYYRRIQRVTGGTAAEFDRWEALADGSTTGYCVDVVLDENGNEVTQRACEGFELCSADGSCERRPCIGDVDCPSGSCLSDGMCGLCTQDEDCLEGQVCQTDSSGTGTCAVPCIPVVECDADSDCPKGSYCSEDLYADKGLEPKKFCAEGCRDVVFCDSDGDCPALEGLYGADASGRACNEAIFCPDGEVCINGTCRYPDNVCLDGRCKYNGGDCAPGEVCRDHGCLPSCSTVEPCANEWETCLGGACVNTGYKCVGDDDCPDELGQCENGICIEDLRCSRSSDCVGDEVCVDGTCRFGDFCFGNSECPADQYCGPGHVCIEGQKCGPGYAPCSFPDTCYQGACQYFPSCEDGCEAGRYCDQGLCVPDLRCGRNEDCLEGFFCNRSGLCQEKSDKPRQPQTIGCSDDCLFFCGPQFTCEPITCNSDNDCPCGSCIAETGLCSTACDSNTDCPAGQRCSSGKCQPCLACQVDAQCPEGIECVDGCCDVLPSCRNDSDCDPGMCVKGECVECRQDGDCAANYGNDELVCVDNQCETPCYTGLSDGSCLEGLRPGETCINCPGQCPAGYVCGENEKVCGTYEVLNPVTNETETRLQMCQVCVRPCLDDASCVQRCDTPDDCLQEEPSYQACITADPNPGCPDQEVCVGGQCVNPPPTCDGGICNGYRVIQDSICGDPRVGTGSRFCEQFDGKCESDYDCQRVPYPSGFSSYCSDFQCVETATCLADDDCDQDERCGSTGLCLPAGEGKCQSDSECGEGYSCGVDGKCGYSCGSQVQAYACSSPDGPYDAGVACPPGFTCNDSTNLCTRPGYEGIGQFMPNCGSGEVCLSGTCTSCSGQAGGGDEYDEDKSFECRANSCCADKEPCDKLGRTRIVCSFGKCVERWRPGAEPFPGASVPSCDEVTDSTPSQDGEDEKPDLCAARGECCDDRGFCAPCACDEDNPCGSRYVREGNSLVEKLQCCDSQTNTCMDIDSHPLTRFGAPGECSLGGTFCEVLGPEGEQGEERSTVDVTSFGEKGERLTDAQIATILGQECNPPSDKEECECTVEIPSTDECLQDSDCPNDQECQSKTFRGDACCPVADENGNDYIVRNVCKGSRGDGQCTSDDDCTACEFCFGYIPGTPDREGSTGICKEDCLNRCPDGGELTEAGQRCNTCEEYYGPCAEGVTLEEQPAYVDPDTGEYVDAVTRTTCRVRTDSRCCEGIASLDEARTNRDGCLVKQVRTDGVVYYDQVDFCVDFDQDICAECTVDSHCPGPNSKCKNYVCITECGSENSMGSDYVGNCSCCTKEGECKELYESWSESVETAPGADGVQSYQNRPCACTETGIDCGPWKASDSCYKWTLVNDSANADGITPSDQAKAERERLQGQYNQFLGLQSSLDEELFEANAVLSEAAALLNQAQVDAGIICNSSDACEAVKESRDDANDKVNDWISRLSDLNAEMDVLVNVDLPAAQPALQDAQSNVSINCPGPLCAIDTDALNTAQGAVDVIELTLIPEKQQEIDDATIEKDKALEDRDYWDEQHEEVCGYSPAGVSDTNPLCTQAQSDLAPLVQAHTEALSTAQSAFQAAEENRATVLEIEAQLGETIYEPSEWRQEVRDDCKCCIDGQCRDDSECGLGTCWLCQKENEGTYRVKLYTSVNENEVCMGCTGMDGSPAGNAKHCPDEAGGANHINFVTENECVKYRCDDKIRTHFEPCLAQQNRWWDTCAGSIIGCVLGQNSITSDPAEAFYWNGYDYQINCPHAGTWAYNEQSDSSSPGYGTDWVRLTKPEERRIDSECAYPNPLGASGGNWLASTAALVQLHPCCAEAVTIYECDPEKPDCTVDFDLIFDRGDSVVLLKRIENQLAALERYLENITTSKENVTAKREEYRNLAIQLESDLEDLRNNSAIPAIENEIANVESLIATDQNTLSTVESEEQSLADALSTAEGKLFALLDEQSGYEEEIRAFNEDRDQKVADRDAALTDGTAKQAEWNSKNARLSNILNIERPELESYLIVNQCTCGFTEDDQGNRSPNCPSGSTAANEDDLVCVLKLQEYEDLEQERTDLETELPTLLTEYQDFFSTADDLAIEISAIDADISRSQSKIDAMQGALTRATNTATAARDDLTAKRQERAELINGIADNQRLLNDLNTRLEQFTENEALDIQALLDEIAVADTSVDLMDQLFSQLETIEDDVEQQIADKTTERDDLAAALDTPAKPEPSERPIEGSTSEEIQEYINDIIQEAEQSEPWIPGS